METLQSTFSLVDACLYSMALLLGMMVVMGANPPVPVMVTATVKTSPARGQMRVTALNPQWARRYYADSADRQLP